MFKLIRKDYIAFGHIIFFQFILVMLLMSFGLLIDQKGTMTFVALLFYPLLVPIAMLIGDKKYFTMSNAIPVSRYSVVLSKYIGGLFAALLIIAIGMFYGYIVVTYINNSVNFSQVFTLKGLCIIIIPLILTTGLVFPIFFKFSNKNSVFVLTVFIIIIVLSMLIGLVYMEKTLTTSGINYTNRDMFPVLMHYLTNYIRRVGESAFIMQLILGTLGTLIISVLLSLWGFSTKDIDE